MSTFEELLKSLKDDDVLGDGWSWSRTHGCRVSSDNWRMTVKGDGIEVRPARDLRGGDVPVLVKRVRYPVLTMIVLTYTDGTEAALEKRFEKAQ